MKKLLFFAALLAVVACGPKNYNIKGTVTADEPFNGKVYLANLDREAPIKDSAEVVNGIFTFQGVVNAPEYFSISLEGVKGSVRFFLENEEFNVTFDSKNPRASLVEGGATQSLFNEFIEKRKELSADVDQNALMKEYYNAETTAERKEEIVKIFDEISAKEVALKDSLLKANPLSNFSLLDFQQKVRDFSIEEAEARISEYKAKPEFANSKVLAAVEEVIAKLKPLQVGCVAPDFTQNDTEGNPVKFSDVYSKNKVTMIDFWAGWCGPCRAFNPTLLGIYNEFHAKGFEVLGVSLDRDKENWLKAIQDDKLPWLHVSDCKYWQNEVAVLYAIQYVPQNIFIGQDGKVLARELKHDEIVPFLKEQLEK